MALVPLPFITRRSVPALSCYGIIRDRLSEGARSFWDGRPEILQDGIVHSGRLEKYLHGFVREHLSKIHAAPVISRLLSFSNPTDEPCVAHWNTVCPPVLHWRHI